MRHTHYPSPGKQPLAWAITTITAALAFAPWAFAADSGGAPLEEIQITGSRIRVTDGMTAPTPVTSVTTEDLASFEPGATVAEQLDALPQFFATQTAQRGGLSLSGSAGVSFLNMRSLGANRTLTLVDGSRITPQDKQGPINVDTVPTALVRSVDVVTGGASAAYGADALGGVTNFILDRNYQGFKASVGTGINEFGDGFKYTYSLAGGTKIGERLSLTGSFQGLYNKQIERNPEDLNPEWFQRWGYVTNPAWSAAVAAGKCSVNIWCEAGPQRLTMPNIAPTDTHIFGMIKGTNTVLDRMVFNQSGTEVAPIANFYGDLTSASGTGTTNSTSGGRLAELANRAYSGPITGNEVVGRSIFFSGKYQFTDDFSAYLQYIGGVSESNAPERHYARTTGIDISSTWAPIIAIDNAYVPEYVRSTLEAAGKKEFTLDRNGAFWDGADMGITWRDRNIFTSKTLTVGFNWDINRDWNLTGSYSTGKSVRNSAVANMIRVDRMFLAMDAVRDPKSGNIVCRVQLYNPTPAQLAAAGLASGLQGTTSRANPDPHPLASPIGLDNTVRDCVPFNVMGFGNISREAINYIGTDKYSVGIVEQDFAETVLSGKVFDGWGYGPVSAAFGLTYRTPSFVDEAFPLDVDALGPPQNAPELGIRGIPAGYTGGSPNLHQFSTVPYIYGDYSVWEWFTEWQVPVWESASKAQRVNSQIAFRSSNYNLSGRSDTWKLGIDAQLMEGLRFRATKSLDVREASFSERFDSQGGGGAVRDRFNADVNTSITVTATGNPDLSPETANTLVAGIVLQPTWRYLDGLSVSADWYKVDISGSIQQISAQDVMDRCFAGDQEQCSHIIREADGTVAGITRMFFNQDMAKVKGVDLEMSYRMTPNFFPDQKETLNVRLLSGWLRERKDINRAGVVTNLLGGYATPTFTGNLTATYGVGPWGFQLQGRYIIGGKLNRLYVEGIQVDKNWLPSVTTWNGQINYRGEFASGATWMAGLAVQNLFDRNPPIILSTATTGAQGTISNQYDAYGRRYNVSLNVNF